jgi:hypothetical protein
VKFLIKGAITDSNNNPLSNIVVQAMDSDQGFFEDHNDDILESCRTSASGSFEISFNENAFKDRWTENDPEVYLIVRNEDGQILHRTDILDINKPAKITLSSLDKKTDLPSPDPYAGNVNRIISSFRSLGDVTTFNSYDFERNFRLLVSSINAWLVYTNEAVWKEIGYDGPQVPRYPYRVPGHSHKLSWEAKN